jgi:hypothetical protein
VSLRRGRMSGCPNGGPRCAPGSGAVRIFLTQEYFPVHVTSNATTRKNTGGNLMVRPRYTVFDDAIQDQTLGWTADQFAEALRSPLAAIGVRVVRRHSVGSTSPTAGFQVRGCTRGQYKTMLNMVDHIVNGVINSLSGKN